MKLNFNSVLLSTEDLQTLVGFYRKVFEKEPEMNDDTYAGFLVGTCFFSIGFHDKVSGSNLNPERIIFNFETDDVTGEFERIKEMGATVIKEPYEVGPEDNKAWIATLADPDGNYFQLMTPWEEKQ